MERKYAAARATPAGVAVKGTGSDAVRRKKKSGFARFIEKYFRIGRGMDWGFFGIVVLLVTIGLVMLYSASYPISYYENSSSKYIFGKQCKLVAAGFAVMMAASFFKYEKLKSPIMEYLVLGISYAGLIFVAVKGVVTGEVSRWIGVGSISIQASEITKFALIMFFAYFCDKYYAQDGKIILIGGIVLLSTAVLLFLEPHYSAIAIMILLTFVMMFLGGVKVRWFVIVGALVALAVALLYATGNLGYAMQRLDGWGQALTAEYGTELYETTRQTRNSMYAIGSGGLTGLGFGESRQKYLFLPEPQNDFIFAIVCEELGFVGALLILMLFALLIYQGIKISQQARDRFGRLLGVGIIIQIALQVILNLLVITDWMPNTGISLPFFSSGGSSIIMIMLQMGVVLSISRTAKIEKL